MVWANAIRPAALLAGGLLLLVLAPAAAQDCLEYADNLRWLNSVPGDGHLSEGVLLGEHLLMLDTFTGLLVYDVTDPRAPVRVGEIELPGSIYCVDAAGDHAYVTSGTDGLLVVDVSDPTAPVLVGQTLTGPSGFWVRLVGDHAYVSDNASALNVVDVSDPTAPEVVGTLDLGGGAARLAAGRHVMPWDGRDRAGRALASGVYLVRLVSGPVAESRKLTLLK